MRCSGNMNGLPRMVRMGFLMKLFPKERYSEWDGIVGNRTKEGFLINISFRSPRSWILFPGDFFNFIKWFYSNEALIDILVWF